MPLSLAGTLKDPYGNPLPSAVIRFDAVVTSSAVLNHTSAEATTDATGAYAIQVEFGRYDIRVQTGRSFYDLARGVQITSSTNAATLNELIVDWQAESTVTPQIIIEMREIADETRGYRDAANTSATAAATSEQNADASEAGALASQQAAAASEANASTSETNAASSASAASASETNAANSATSASNSADAAATSETNAASSASSASSSASAAATSETNAATSETNAANSASAAESSAMDAAASAASVDASNIVHAPGSGLANEAGSAAFADTGDFDAAGSAQAAQDYAIQRANHTGTQPLSTISDAGTAAAANTGTGASNVPTTSEADQRYARLSGGNDFGTMPMVAGAPIVESGSNSDGEWTRWGDGSAYIRSAMPGISITTANDSGLFRSELLTWHHPIPLVSGLLSAAGGRIVNLGSGVSVHVPESLAGGSSTSITAWSGSSSDDRTLALWAAGRWK